MRVIAGRFKGRRIEAPAGLDTRPTSDRVREAVFNILGPLDGARVLDLYAGSGALGIEALSRGAVHATFVDADAAAVKAIRDNLVPLDADADVRRQDAERFVAAAAGAEGAYDLVFLDPPYGSSPPLALAPLLAPGGRVIGESAVRAPLELDLPITDERRYGKTLIRIHTP